MSGQVWVPAASGNWVAESGMCLHGCRDMCEGRGRGGMYEERKWGWVIRVRVEKTEGGIV